MAQLSFQYAAADSLENVLSAPPSNRYLLQVWPVSLTILSMLEINLIFSVNLTIRASSINIVIRFFSEPLLIAIG